MKPWVRTIAPGFLVGYTVTRLGFTDYNELHRMLIFKDLRLIFAFACGVGTTLAVFKLAGRRIPFQPVRFRKGTLLGAVLFGVGWALAGACPGVALVQVAQGVWPAFVSFFGMLAGMWLHKRWTGGKASNGGSC